MGPGLLFKNVNPMIGQCRIVAQSSDVMNLHLIDGKETCGIA